MLDLGWQELMLIAGVAVLVVSPKDLPRAMRSVGKWVGQMRQMARGFQNQFNEALKEAELDDVRKDVERLAKVDPVGDIKKEINKAGADLKKEMEAPADKAGDAGKAEDTGEVKDTGKAAAAGPALVDKAPTEPKADTAPKPAAKPAPAANTEEAKA